MSKCVEGMEESALNNGHLDKSCAWEANWRQTWIGTNRIMFNMGFKTGRIDRNTIQKIEDVRK